MNKFDPHEDYCTCWFESMYGVSIKWCCYLHDETLSTKKFYECLKGRIGAVSALAVAGAAALALWVSRLKI